MQTNDQTPDKTDIESRFIEAHATLGAISALMWGRDESCDELSNSEVIQIGRALASATERVEKAFFEALHMKTKGGQA